MDLHAYSYTVFLSKACVESGKFNEFVATSFLSRHCRRQIPQKQIFCSTTTSPSFHYAITFLKFGTSMNTTCFIHTCHMGLDVEYTHLRLCTYILHADPSDSFNFCYSLLRVWRHHTVVSPLAFCPVNNVMNDGRCSIQYIEPYEVALQSEIIVDAVHIHQK